MKIQVHFTFLPLLYVVISNCQLFQKISKVPRGICYIVYIYKYFTRCHMPFFICCIRMQSIVWMSYVLNMPFYYFKFVNKIWRIQVIFKNNLLCKLTACLCDVKQWSHFSLIVHDFLVFHYFPMTMSAIVLYYLDTATQLKHYPVLS